MVLCYSSSKKLIHLAEKSNRLQVREGNWRCRHQALWHTSTVSAERVDETRKGKGHDCRVRGEVGQGFEPSSVAGTKWGVDEW